MTMNLVGCNVSIHVVFIQTAEDWGALCMNPSKINW